MSETSIVLNTDSASRAARRVGGILLGLFAGFAAYALMMIAFGPAETSQGSAITGGITGVAALLVWWLTRSDQRAADAAGDKTLVTTTTSMDILVTAFAVLGGVFFAGLFVGVSMAAALAGAVGVMVGYWSGRWIWTGVATSSDPA